MVKAAEVRPPCDVEDVGTDRGEASDVVGTNRGGVKREVDGLGKSLNYRV